MSILDKVESGKQERAPKLIIAGQPAVGKSTFASQFPKPLFLTAEDRTSHLDIHRINLESWEDCLKSMAAVGKGEGDYETIVIDTLDALQPLLFEFICREQQVTNILEVGGGYFQFRAPMLVQWKRFMNIVDKLAAKGVQCVMLAHTEIKTFTPPDSPAYDRYALKLDTKAADFLIENADLVGYAKFAVVVQTDKTPAKKGKGKSVGRRDIGFKFNPAYPSKQGIPFADNCDLTYEAWKNAHPA